MSREDPPYGDPLDMATLWPRMERLVLGRNPHFAPTNEFGFFLPVSLPRSLTHLTLIYNLQFQEFDFPDGLLSLHSPENTGKTPDWPQYLPKSLTELSVNPNTNNHLERNPSILSKVKGLTSHNLFFSMMAPGETFVWPSALALSCHPSDLQHLTGSLITHLILYTGSQLTGEHIRLLPAHLQRFDALELDWNRIEVSDWLSQPTHLSVRAELDHCVKCFAKLPRSITRLDLTTNRGEDCPDNSPPFALDLDSLRAAGRASLALESWSKDKQALLARASLIPDYDPTAYIDAVEAGGLLGLPLSLTSLIFGPYPCFNLEKQLLPILAPPNMKTFSSRHSFRYDDPFLSLIPPLSDAHFKVSLQPKDARPSVAKSLPLLRANITHLDLTLTGNFLNIPPLPAKLQRLTLTCDTTCALLPLDSLPSTLESLSSPSMTSADLDWPRLLPRGLKSCYLPRMPLHGRHFSELPPLLERLTASMWKARLDDIFRLPKSLRYLLPFVATNDVGEAPSDVIGYGSWKVLCDAYRPLFRIWEAGKEPVGSLLASQRKEILKRATSMSLEQAMAYGGWIPERIPEKPFP